MVIVFFALSATNETLCPRFTNPLMVLHTTMAYPPFCGNGTRWLNIRIFNGAVVFNKNNNLKDLPKVTVQFKLILVKILQYKDMHGNCNKMINYTRTTSKK